MFGRLADHPVDILLIVLLAVVLFGGKRLPEAARGLGRSMRIFKSEISAMNDDKSAPAKDKPAPDALEGRVLDAEQQPKSSTEPRRDA